MAATNRDLEAEVKAGRFREDLLYRLDVVSVTVPPLRERPEDILGLARRFLAFFGRDRRASHRTSPRRPSGRCVAYPWPGNVRELRNALERAVILSRRAGPPAARASRSGSPRTPPACRCWAATATVDDIEREHILRVLARTPTAEEAARVLGIDASTLWRKRKRYGR